MNYPKELNQHLNKQHEYHQTLTMKLFMSQALFDGTLRAREWGYPISYAQEWKTVIAQKRIGSLCTLLPI